MKPLYVIAAVIGLHGAQPAMASQHATAPKAAEASFTEGEVRRIDKAAGKITLKHGPIAHLEMPAMSMVFQAKPKALLDRLKEGDKVRFKAEKIQGAYVVTEIQAAP